MSAGGEIGRRRRRIVLLLTVLSTVPFVSSPSSAPQASASAERVRFVESAAEAGIDFRSTYGSREKRYITEMAGSGAGWVDFDRDGRLDLLLVNGLPEGADDPAAASRSLRGGAGDGGFHGRRDDAAGASGHALYRGHRERFREVGRSAGVDDRVWGNGVAVGDVDNDGFDDLYVTAIGPNRLYRNNGDGTFSRWPAGVEDPGWGTSAAFVDWNADGDLDLYVANYVDFDASTTPTPGDGVCTYRGIEVFCGPEGLEGARDAFYRNEGDGSFEPWEGAEVDPERTYGFALVATDCDGDRLPDLYVATDSTMNLLYRHGEGSMPEDWSLFSGAGFSGGGREQAGMGVAASDYDGDGDQDLHVTNFQNDYNTLYESRGGCTFDDVSERVGLATESYPFMGWATLFLDVDGDGDDDLFVANGHIYPQVDAAGVEPYEQRNLLYLNRRVESGTAGFDEVGESAGPGMSLRASSRGAALGDYDNDGDEDILVSNINDRAHLLRNDSDPAGRPLRLTLVSRSGNRDAYGAVVTVEAGDRRWTLESRASDGYVGSNDPRLLVHVPAARARLRIAWPGGASTELDGVEPGWLVVDEARGVVAKARR